MKKNNFQNIKNKINISNEDKGKINYINTEPDIRKNVYSLNNEEKNTMNLYYDKPNSGKINSENILSNNSGNFQEGFVQRDESYNRTNQISKFFFIYFLYIFLNFFEI